MREEGLSLTDGSPDGRLDHLTVASKAEKGRKKIPKTPRFRPNFADYGNNRAAHVKHLCRTLSESQQAAIHAQTGVPADIRAQGFSTVAVSVDSEYGLQLTEIQKRAHIVQFRPAVDEDTDIEDEAPGRKVPSRAVLWVSPTQLVNLQKDIDKFTEETEKGNPRNQALVANISGFRPVELEDLWREEADIPAKGQGVLWELWYESTNDFESSSYPLLNRLGSDLDLTVLHPVLQVGDYYSCLVEGTRENIERLLNTKAMPVEVRLPSFMEELEALGDNFVQDWVSDFTDLLDPAEDDAPVVTVLDNGVKANHPLLAGSLRGRVWTVVENFSGDDMFSRHGTGMAGVALFGDLRDHLDRGAQDRLTLVHGLEVVRVLRRSNDVHDSHRTPAILMANAVAEAEIRRPTGRRVFLLAQTMTNRSVEELRRGIPTAWSTTLDALSMGCEVEVGEDIVRVGAPETGAQRLFCVSIGNIRGEDLDAIGMPDAFPSTNVTRIAEDPTQAWNVLRIGAFTERDEVPASGHYEGWRPVAPPGALSPHSRTGVAANKSHASVPDIVLEGGNLLRSPSGDLDHPSSVSIITTAPDSAAPLTHTFATSASAAQAARLATLAQSRYPGYWPETIRGLLVHRARWTDYMASGIHGPRNGTLMTKGQFDADVLRMYGWGVPREEQLLTGDRSDVTTIIQDSLKPFDAKSDPGLDEVKFHGVPWSQELVEGLGGCQVELRVTLSYFVEPNPGKRGPNHHTTYPSHGLQYLIKSGTQSSSEFHRDLSEVEGAFDNSGVKLFSAGPGWVAGPQKRDRGTLRTDMWRGSASKLLGVDEIAVVPLTGWWKLHRRRDRCRLSVRYSLLITLRTLGAEIDLYTNIASTVGAVVATDASVDAGIDRVQIDV